MNKSRRKELDRAVDIIEEARQIISEVATEEQDAFDNMPEGLQESEKGQAISEAADALTMIDDDFDAIIEAVNDTKGG